MRTFLSVAVILLGAFIAAAMISSDHESRARNAATAAVLQQITTGQLDNAVDFQTHCAVRTLDVREYTNVGKHRASGVTLLYPNEDLMVLFTPRANSPKPLSFQISFWRAWRAGAPVDPATALSTLQCGPKAI